MLIDSGANLNTVPEEFWSKIKRAWENNEMRKDVLSDVSYKCDRQVESFGGTRLKVLATFHAEIEVVGASKPLDFTQIFVVEGKTQPLLSRKTAERLKLLKVGLEVNSLKTAPSEGVFPTIPGPPVKLDIDRSIDPKQIPRVRIPLALEEPVRARLREMEEKGVIERAPDTKSFVNPMNVVAKGKNDFRIVIDMREANKAIKRKYHPLPTIENLFAKLAGAKYFTTIDLKSAYHHILLDVDSRDVTTFMTPDGAMRFTRLTFGMNAAPEIFQETMDKVLSGLEGVLIYLDDVLIFAKDLHQLRTRTYDVKAALKANNLALNLEKCQFEKTSVEFLGFTISGEGRQPSKEKLEVIESFTEPTDIKELRSFLGCVTFLGSFIRDLASELEPLRKLTRNSELFVWGEEQKAAFRKIKQILRDDTETHAFFDKTAPTTLYTDASKKGLGAILTQTINGNERIISYASKTLTATEQAYPQTQREALAVVWAVEKFSYYLLGRDFVVATDHDALRYLYGGEYRDNQRAVTRAEGWALRLAAFSFRVIHIPGRENASDALSRMCNLKATPYNEERGVMELGKVNAQLNALELAKTGISDAICLETIKQETSRDETLKRVMSAITSNIWPNDTKPYKPFNQEIFVKEGILIRGHQIILPESLRARALENAHVGHPGIVSMKRTLRDRMWWPGMDKEVARVIQKCRGCTSVARDDPPEPMERTQLPEHPMDFVAIDHWSAQSVPSKILVITDYFSRYLWYRLVKDTTSKETIIALEEIFDVFGNPKTLRADNGTAYQSREFKDWCASRDIAITFSIPLWPQHNGQVEKAMQLFNKNLTIARALKENWKDSIRNAVRAYNNQRVHSTTGSTPAEAMFKRRLRGALPTITVKRMISVEEMQERDATQKLWGKENADAKRHARQSEIVVGDKVFMRGKGTDKLSAKFDIHNPCIVLEKRGATAKIRTPEGVVFERNVTALKKDQTEGLTEIPKFENERGLPATYEAANPSPEPSISDMHNLCLIPYLVLFFILEKFKDSGKQGDKQSIEESTEGGRTLRNREKIRAPEKLAYQAEETFDC